MTTHVAIVGANGKYFELLKPLKPGTLLYDVTPLESQMILNASRYQALRECTWHSHPMCVVMDPKKTVRLGSWCPSHSLLDDEVDKYIATLPYPPNRG